MLITAQGNQAGSSARRRPGDLRLMKSFSLFPSRDKTKRRHNFNEEVFKRSD